ncbi:MAG: HEPN domain-containing protein [Crenarchaeota archaeon]|nr:HEPN domain-containing protein [Thermoproteota archaeon]
MLAELDDCFTKGLIRRIVPSKDKALRSLGKANRWLEEAKKSLGFSLFNSCLVASYSAMFHAARALLFKDGFREKSHYCLARYLEEKYVKTGKLDRVVVDLLDRFRALRHEDLYELDFSATKEDAEEAVRNAELVVSEIGRLLLSSLF